MPTQTAMKATTNCEIQAGLREVTFATGVEVKSIAEGLGTWENGPTCADEPTDYELAHARALSEQTLAHIERIETSGQNFEYAPVKREPLSTPAFPLVTHNAVNEAREHPQAGFSATFDNFLTPENFHHENHVTRPRKNSVASLASIQSIKSLGRKLKQNLFKANGSV